MKRRLFCLMLVVFLLIPLFLYEVSAQTEIRSSGLHGHLVNQKCAVGL